MQCPCLRPIVPSVIRCIPTGHWCAVHCYVMQALLAGVAHLADELRHGKLAGQDL